MKRYLPLFLILMNFALGPLAMADETDQKTDGSFVGEGTEKPINSSFVGDDSKSVDNDSFVGENMQQETDSQFVGANSMPAENTYFAGQSYHQEVSTSTDQPFAQDNTRTPSTDGVFVGQDTRKDTDGSFDGENYGK